MRLQRPDSSEVKRLMKLWADAEEARAASARKWYEGRQRAGRDRIAYFEKLALFNGATIALVISSLASGRIQIANKYSLRAALISLVVAMCSAMARNWFYHHYSIVALRRMHAEKVRKTEEARINYLRIYPVARDIETGKLFNTQEAVEDFNNSDATNAQTIRDSKKVEHRLHRSYQICEWLTHSGTVAGIAMLTIIAILTF